MERVGQLFYTAYFHIRNVQLLFVEAVICLYAPCVCVHCGLHRFFKLLGGINASVLSEEAFGLGDMRPYLGFGNWCGLISGDISQCGEGCYLPLGKCACDVFLRATPCHISCGEKSAYCGGTVCIYPVSAGGMTAHYVGLCALYLNILLGNFLSALYPLYSLRGCHIEVGIDKGLFLFGGDPLGLKVAGTSALQIFVYRSVNTLGGGETVFCFIDLAQ